MPSRRWNLRREQGGTGLGVSQWPASALGWLPSRGELNPDFGAAGDDGARPTPWLTRCAMKYSDATGWSGDESLHQLV